MTRIAATAAEDFKFQQNDNPPTRVQKLELLRKQAIAAPSRAKLRFLA